MSTATTAALCACYPKSTLLHLVVKRKVPKDTYGFDTLDKYSANE